jgi:hypothetical protein
MVGRHVCLIPVASGPAAHATQRTRVAQPSRARLLVNGSPDGLVELRVDPPFRTDRALSTGFVRARVDRVVVSLVDPEAFLAALAVTSDANE